MVALGGRTDILLTRTFDQMAAVLAWILDRCRSVYPELSVERRRVLEVGTGNTVNHPVAFRMVGAELVTTVDLTPKLDPRMAREAIARSVVARRVLSEYVSHDRFMEIRTGVLASDFTRESLEPLGIHYVAPIDLTRQELPGVFDVVFSYAVLEHVPLEGMSPLLGAMDRLLAPGGHAIHFVDMEDHRSPAKEPFAFLGEAGHWSAEACGQRGNRLRLSTFKELLGASPYDWQTPYIAVRHDADLPRVADAVRCDGEADLRTTACVLVGRKPN